MASWKPGFIRWLPYWTRSSDEQTRLHEGWDAMFDTVKRAMHRHNDGSWEEMRPSEDVSEAQLDPERQWLKEGVVYECPCGDSFFVQHGDRGSNDLLAVPHA